MLGRVLFAVFVCIIVDIVVFINFLDRDILKTISGCMMTFVYAVVLYSGASKLGKFDAKPYTKLKVQLWRPLIWGVLIGLINIAFFAIYKINWATMPKGEDLPSLMSVIINGLFYVWNSPFIAFIIGNTNGHISLSVVILMAVVPVIACFLGYFAGSRNLLVLDKVDNFMFENNNSEE